jgi:hypothetical protein
VDLTDAEADAAVAARAVDRALAETLGPVARRLLEEVRERHARFLMTQAALSAVGSLCGDPWSETRKEIDRAGLFTDALARLSSATEKEWLDAIKALRENADAPLPE